MNLLDSLIVKAIVSHSVGRRLVDVSELVCVLLLTLLLVEELFVLRVELVVVHAVDHVGAVVPGGYVLVSRLFNAVTRIRGQIVLTRLQNDS